MVVTNSESDHTLLSLEEESINNKAQQQQQQSESSSLSINSYSSEEEHQAEASCNNNNNNKDLFETYLRVPSVTTKDADGDSNSSSNKDDDNNNITYSSVFLPKSGAVEVTLGRLPHLRASRQELLDKGLVRYGISESSSSSSPPPRILSSSSSSAPPPRILYLAQREFGSALPSQADVIVSDRATTCHVLILRSTLLCHDDASSNTTDSIFSEPMTSCAHLDAPWYDECLANMFDQHYQHHHHNSNHHQQQHNRGGSRNTATTKIYMDIHIVGGFLDPKGRSQDLSNWLLYRLAGLASDYRHVFVCRLQTCVISTLNHTWIPSNHPDDDNDNDNKLTAAPLGRGLACDLNTGRVSLAWCDESVMGPDPTLRQARLWSCHPPDHLVTVHRAGRNDNNSNVFVIPPFDMASYNNIPRLLSMSKGELLYNSSTSPACEEDDYIDTVRKALSLLQRYSTKKVFGSTVAPRHYVRGPPVSNDDSSSGNQNNKWKLLPSSKSAKTTGHGTKHPNHRRPRSRRESKKLRGQSAAANDV